MGGKISNNEDLDEDDEILKDVYSKDYSEILRESDNDFLNNDLIHHLFSFCDEFMIFLTLRRVCLSFYNMSVNENFCRIYLENNHRKKFDEFNIKGDLTKKYWARNLYETFFQVYIGFLRNAKNGFSYHLVYSGEFWSIDDTRNLKFRLEENAIKYEYEVKIDYSRTLYFGFKMPSGLKKHEREFKASGTVVIFSKSANEESGTNKRVFHLEMESVKNIRRKWNSEEASYGPGKPTILEGKLDPVKQPSSKEKIKVVFSRNDEGEGELRFFHKKNDYELGDVFDCLFRDYNNPYYMKFDPKFKDVESIRFPVDQNKDFNDPYVKLIFT